MNDNLKKFLEKHIIEWQAYANEYKDKEKFEDFMEDLALQRVYAYQECLEELKRCEKNE